LVYCSKCGEENRDDAVVCKKCGASLYPSAYRDRRDDWDVEDMCFGGRNRTLWPILLGVFIILVGLSSLLERSYRWFRIGTIWPIFLIAIGLLFVYNAMERR